MAEIPKADGLLTKFYLVAAGTTVETVANVETAIATAKQITEIETFGDFDLGTYAVATKSLFGGGVVKSLGSKTIGNVAASIVFDALNATGQAEIGDMHTNKTYRILIVQLDDEPTSGATPHPTYLVVKIGVSDLKMPIATGDMVMYNATLEFMELPTMHKAALTTP